MRDAALLGSSCSHTRTTRQPASRKRSSVSSSRLRFVSILFRQNSAFAFGQVACCGHPCQKHPSTKTATRARGKTMSARRRRPLSTCLSTRNRRPDRCSAERRANSAAVSRWRVLFIRCRAAREDGLGVPLEDTSSHSTSVDPRGTQGHSPCQFQRCPPSSWSRGSSRHRMERLLTRGPTAQALT
jgi:hypothetical protein